MTYLILCLAFYSSFLTLHSPQEARIYRVLFVGNSLTYSQEIPKILEKVARVQGIKIRTHCICHPNYALIDHWQDASLATSLDKGNYDWVILQQGPSSQEQGRQWLLQYGELLVQLAREYGVEPAFYMVWPAQKYYHTFPGVIQNYTDAAQTNDALLLPVGQVWKKIVDENSISLYAWDGFHPSPQGGFVAAWTIFMHLFPDGDASFSPSYQSFLEKDKFNRIRFHYSQLSKP